MSDLSIQRYEAIREFIQRDERIKGNLAEFARLIGKDPSYCRRSLGEKPTSKVTAKFVREIERALDLEPKYFEQATDKNQSILTSAYHSLVLAHSHFKELQDKHLINEVTPTKTDAILFTMERAINDLNAVLEQS